jgi:hypothetical protein
MYKRGTVPERFWAKVQKGDGCWLWTGYRDARQRGFFGIGVGVTEHIQRVAWRLTHGFIPEGQWVRSRCRNTLCCNPAHLVLGNDVDFLVDRFMAFVQKTETCWLWTGTIGNDGYGQFRQSKAKRVRAHRFSYELAHGPIPDGLSILHRCDNPICCNPGHLSVGTQADNIRDRDAKGHVSRGEGRPAAKVTEAQVREMRARFAAGGVTQTALALDFGLSLATANKILRRKAWRHVL